MVDGRRESDAAESSGRLSIPAQILLCLVIYAVTWPFFLRFNFLPQSAYEGPVILASALTHLPTLAFLILGLFVLFVRRSEITWAAIDPEWKTRGLVFLLQFPLVLQLAFYDYNYFYDHTHIVDRLAIVICWLLIARHPAFLFPFACIVMVVFFQLFHPLPGVNANWPDKLLPMRILFLLNACVFLRLFVTLHRSVLLLSTLVLTAGLYAHSAVSKLVLGPELWSWLTEDQLAFLFVGAYKNGGWLASLSDQQVVKIATWMKPFGLAQRVVTLLIEGGAVLIFLGRRPTRILLAGCIVLHLAILATSSIFFWKWIVVDFLLLVYAERYWRSDEQSLPPLRARWLLVSFAMLLSLFVLYSEGPLFAWWDTRHCKYCTYEVETSDGDRVRLDPHYFAPYDLTFVQSRYYYAVPHKVIPGTFGVTYDIEARKVLNNMTVEEFPRVREQFGIDFYNTEQADAYRHFLQRYLTNAMKRERKNWLPTWFPPPYHFQSRIPSDTFWHGSQVVKLHVYFEEYFFDNEQIHQLSRTEVLQIPITRRTTPNGGSREAQREIASRTDG